MAISWRLRATVFQLLAAVYAEFGEEAFKGRYVSIARYFGPDATYDSIKSFFAKEVSRAAEQLKAKNRDHQGSGRRAPARPSPSARLSRPPHLYFDDEDLSILTQREAEAHFGHSLRAPAKRPRVIKVSPVPQESDAVVYCGTAASHPINEPLTNGHTSVGPGCSQSDLEEPVVAGPSSNPESASYATAQSHHIVAEPRSKSNKRPFAAVDDTVNNHAEQSLAPATPSPPRLESFGYVTNQGNYRCALCLSQLPSEEDLARHEALSKEHMRNLKNTLKVSKGRAKLGQVAAVLIGRHQSTPAPANPFGTGSVQPRQQPLSIVEANCTQAPQPVSNGTPVDATIQEQTAQTVPQQNHIDLPMDTIEVRGRSLSILSSGITRDQRETAPALRDKGKGRALSIMSTEPAPQSHTITQSPDRPSQPVSISTRPTSARTEIGSLTPLQPKDTGSTNSKPGAPMFSPTDLADIMRNTEMMIQLMTCVQREAVTVAGANGISRTMNSTGSSSRNYTAAFDGQDSKTTSDAVSSLDLGASPIVNGYSSASGVNGNGNDSSEPHDKRGRVKDTGEGVLFICLDD
ncbi:hypothetical protein LTR10_017590 [Elasticomyces elasticus]|uniref:DUF7066 domain-containing protein n=1 Tax=Exophiala sideris TaxID=1016849 RepID=A0ABR0JP11_9EURO|nr:hypothetical protein LTR10_017590 [Elasticomyces elasticus]KAK5038236.1 hypothetical protein LTS07_001705 [Exophiala sideris]KAK5044220.1 hypothetical protein LTR13_000576 [Exophiala sideris]KAK5067720.1 hypothetical protein LTR69_001709 [Exophiala sideris]KAK5184040.1 hypothetical protein LTR44_003546 [Eurotiomycetes sp. CCFEE 6388]